MKKILVMGLLCTLSLCGCGNSKEREFDTNTKRFTLIVDEKYECNDRGYIYKVVDSETGNIYLASPNGQNGFIVSTPLYDENGQIEKYVQ